MEIKELPIQDIQPYEKNPRRNDEAVKYVAQSIKDFGFKVPIVIDANNVIICGHTRYKAAKKLGLETVPCVLATDLNEEQVKAYRLADNKVSEKAEWDLELLFAELADIQSYNMEDFGFESALEEEPTEAKEDNFDPEEILEEEEPICKRGEIYQLGRHRLMCGDSTSEDDVQKLMNGAEADLVVTDPPYNVNVSNSQGMKIENDNMESQAFLDFLTACFHNLEANLKAGGAFYVWLATKEWTNFERALNNNGLRVRQELIWNKNGATFGRSDYHWKHEPCMYGWKEGAAHYFIDDHTQTTVIEDARPEPKKMKKEELIELVEYFLRDTQPTTIINEAKPTINDLHPTMKPLKLMGRLITNSSKKGEKVLDLFGGSGSTMMACEQLNRTCYMMEYDPKYADVIIARWEQMTGQKAKKIC